MEQLQRRAYQGKSMAAQKQTTNASPKRGKWQVTLSMIGGRSMRGSLQMGNMLRLQVDRNDRQPCRIGKILRRRPEGTTLGLGWLLTPKKCCGEMTDD
jgi:hypothetical protein